MAGAGRFLLIDSYKSWDEYYRGLSRHVKDEISRHSRHLSKHGALTHIHCSSEEEFTSYLKVLFELHRRRWNSTDTPSQFNDRSACSFYLETVAKLFPKGQIDLFVLKAGEVPVFLSYAFIFDGRWQSQTHCFDLDYAKSAPGTVGAATELKDAFARGTRVMDFGDYFHYKTKWTKSCGTKLSLEVYPSKPVSLAAWLLAATGGPMRAQLRKIGVIRNLVRRMRRRANNGAQQQENHVA